MLLYDPGIALMRETSCMISSMEGVCVWGRMESRACPTTLGSQMKTSNILHQCNQAMNRMRYAVQHGNQHAYEDHPATVCSSAQIFVGARRSHREGNAALASVHTLWLASMIAMLVYFRCQRQVKPGRPAQLPQGRQNPLHPHLHQARPLQC